MKYFIVTLMLVANISYAQNIVFKRVGSEAQKIDSGKVNASEKKIIFRDNAAKEPMYVLYGVPISNTEFNALNPEVIESITVLKDSAVGYFCKRPTNGVIIIKTKKLPKKEIRKMKRKAS